MWVYKGRDEDDGFSRTAIMQQTRAGGGSSYRCIQMMGNTLSRLIFVQARERFHSEIRVISGLLPKHFQKQRQRRSEEHTSELQSLIRISNSGVCMKKENE